MWIKLPRPENPVNTCTRHKETLDSCFNLIRSHQKHLPISPSLEIKPATIETKLYQWATNSLRTEVTSNHLAMVIAWPINLNVSCKLHPYSLQRIRSPPRPRLPRRIRNTHPRNYNLKVIIIWCVNKYMWSQSLWRENILRPICC